MPLQATSGAASYDAFGGGVAVVPNYIEDVFSTWLYTGNGSTQTINNGIDLAGKGGLVWIKGRDAARDNALFDTSRGGSNRLISNSTVAQNSLSSYVSSFDATGFTLGSSAALNASAATFVSWTFREQPKFFDVVTYTGNGTSQNIAHNLGSEPGCMMVKCTSATNDWQVYHRATAAGMGPNKFMVLNSTAGESTGSDRWNNTAPTSSVFTVGNAPETNQNGATYVAYLFAHNAGGFGLTGTDNVISCGSYTGQGGTQFPVTLGYEPQWILVKPATTTGNWTIVDTMRGMVVNNNGLGMSMLRPNLSDAESGQINFIQPTATGFTVGRAGQSNDDFTANGQTYIYIAIRRGPMRTPTSGTSVFAPNTTASTSAVQWNTGFDVDFTLTKGPLNATGENVIVDRLRGTDRTFTTNSGTQESTNANIADLIYSRGYQQRLVGAGGTSSVSYAASRAPTFLDEVCWSGNGAASQTLSHNLTSVPQMIWLKNRTRTNTWFNEFVVYTASLGTSQYLVLNTTGGQASADTWFLNGSTPTASQFVVGDGFNETGQTYTAYLFGNCTGVSRVGTYTGTGTTQTVSCGFAGGARFVMIKRTDNSGDWYVWDTARGMVAGTDPSLLLNTNAAQVNANNIYTTSGGFQIVSTNAGINASGGTYLYWAVA